MNEDSHGIRKEPGADVLDALVQAERAAEPPRDAQKQTLERVMGTLAVGSPPPLEPGSIAGPSASPSWMKLLLTVVLGGAVGIAAVLGYRAMSQPPPRAVATRGAEPTPDPAQKPGTSTAAPSPAPAPPPAQPAPSPARAAAPTSTPAAAPPPAKPRAPTPPPSSDLAEETRLLALARASVRTGAPADALAHLAEHARRFPRGQLQEDRMVLHAIALCESGDTAAGKRAATDLREAFPASSHRARVDRACAGAVPERP